MPRPVVRSEPHHHKTRNGTKTVEHKAHCKALIAVCRFIHIQKKRNYCYLFFVCVDVGSVFGLIIVEIQNVCFDLSHDEYVIPVPDHFEDCSPR